MTRRLDSLRHAGLRPPPLLQPLGLAEAALVAVLEQRAAEPLRARFRELLDLAEPPRADNRLRRAAGLRAAARLLGLPSPPLPSLEELLAAVTFARGVPALWESMADLALGVGRGHLEASALATLVDARLAAPLGERSTTLTTLLCSLDPSAVDDAWAERQAGWLTALSALSAGVVDPVPTLLALPESLQGPALRGLVEAWAEDRDTIDVSPAEWRLPGRAAEGLELRVTVSGGARALGTCLPEVLADVGYRLGEHLHRLGSDQVGAKLVARARTRAQIREAATRGGVHLVVAGDLTRLPPADQAALERRQVAALRWVQTHHPGLVVHRDLRFAREAR